MNKETELEQFIFEVKETNFLSEHGLIHMEKLDYLKRKLKTLIREYGKSEI